MILSLEPDGVEVSLRGSAATGPSSYVTAGQRPKYEADWPHCVL